MLKAFLEQSGIDPDAHDQTEEAEREEAREGLENDLWAQMKATRVMNDPDRKLISKQVDIPTQLKPEELNNPEIKPKYDGHLEKNRWHNEEQGIDANEEYEADDDGMIHVDL